MKTNHPIVGAHRRRPPAAMLAVRFLFALQAFQLVALVGCAPNKRYDLIEAELRTRERELSETRLALDQARNLNRAYAQQSLAAEPAPPTAPVYVPVKEIALGRGTGGLTGDVAGCEEGLMVVVVPRDEDGSAVKAPARLEIAAYDVPPSGQKIPIGNWAVPADKLRSCWRSGFISSGYFVLVPWQTRPCTDRVRLTVRLTTLDGRSFETERDIYVRVGDSRTGPAPGPPPTGPAASPNPAREPLFPDPFPSGKAVPPVAPGTQELPPPRGARLESLEKP